MTAANQPLPPGILFDLDGTLADTLQDLTDAVNAALSAGGFPAHAPSRMRRYIGHRLPVMLAQASGTDDPNLIGTMVETFCFRYKENYLANTRLFPGIADVLTSLQRAGCPMAVLSNKPDDFTGLICSALLAQWPFLDFAGTRDGYPQKPDPTLACELARRMNRSPEQVIIVGDSGIDIETARRAGMRVVAVTWGLRDREELLAERPDMLIDKVEDLPAAIGAAKVG
jgi:phosphoglycolate phosphatase